MSWPAFTKVRVYLEDGTFAAESIRSRLDLADSLGLYHPQPKGHAYRIEVEVRTKTWTTWNTENVEKIEKIIQEDLAFDGYTAEIERVSSPGKTLCAKPFIWTLKMSVDYGESKQRTSVGTRFKSARSDATLKTIKANIEKVFGLPAGSVAIVAPGNRKTDPHSTVKDLKETWSKYRK